MIEFDSKRFQLRELTLNDVTERYLEWLRDADAIKYIAAATKTNELSDLKTYVKDRIGRNDVLFLGIFEKEKGTHIGNIKYEPVNSDLGYAIMGILIGEPKWREKGVGTEVLETSALWLKDNSNINQILLGVNEKNIAGIRSYEKAGFIVADTPYIKKEASGQVTMIWNM
ncbi:Acetyltransferase (GNAT) domain protein [uncultured Woeseiaceae bacterium]|uniref:Acetyltransferase (GNAT) domain protein n=1 Tax=uncultured Woeseiaceae bacterium TaxID=1983305 RepID=A0A7D9D157_9GAMM|nr:Acetyltransferase (GNAT) domain protein [uncultured Woeseiaceae bacterium]